MKERYKKALSEVFAIIKSSDDEIIKKIPYRFIKFVSENRNKDYNVCVEPDKGILNQNISDEAKSIVALMYRDYLCDKEQRTKLISQEIQYNKIEEERKRKQYEIKWNK